MKNKVSVLVTLSNFILIVALGFFWWKDRQKNRMNEWELVIDVVKDVSITCGEKQVIYTNGGTKEELLDFTVLNLCSLPANTWVGVGDSVLKAGTTVKIDSGQRLKSTYELKPGESFIAKSPAAHDVEGQTAEINYHIISRRAVNP